MAQLRLERPAVATKGDRLILRSYSPAETIGGARVLDPQAPRRRRGQAAVGALEALAAAGVAEALDLFLEEAGARGASVASLASRVGLVASEAEAALRGNARAVLLAREPPVALHRAALQGIEDAALQALSGFHRQQPLRSGMPLEELRRRVFGAAPPGAAEHVLAGLVAQGRVRLEPDQVALAGHSVTLTAGEDQARRLASQALEAAGLAGLSLRELAERTRQEQKLVERVARLLVAEGQAARVGEGQLVARPSLDALKVHVRTRWPPGSRLDVAAFKEMTGLTRKHVIPLLEYLDRERVTRRSGDERLVLVESR
jgi:selenocysteine-specific elongation factor